MGRPIQRLYRTTKSTRCTSGTIWSAEIISLTKTKATVITTSQQKEQSAISTAAADCKANRALEESLEKVESELDPIVVKILHEMK